MMVKAFASDPELKNVKVYAMIRLVYHYTPSDYVEPDSEYKEEGLCD